MTTQAKPKYVYGVTPRTASALRGTGIRRRRLHAIEDGQLAAIVSDAPEGDIQAGREELLTHARVLGRARAQGVVLPMRFGVVMPDEDAVRRELLEEYRDELLLQLREVDGKGELRLRAVYEEEALMKEIVEAHSDIAGLSSALRGRPVDAMYYERIELGQKVAHRRSIRHRRRPRAARRRRSGGGARSRACCGQRLFSGRGRADTGV